MMIYLNHPCNTIALIDACSLWYDSENEAIVAELPNGKSIKIMHIRERQDAENIFLQSMKDGKINLAGFPFEEM